MKTNLREWLCNSANIEPDVQVEKDSKLVDKSLEAFEYLRTFDTLNHERVKEAHRILMEHRQPRIAGKYRETPVQIGALKTGETPEMIELAMENQLSMNAEPEAWNLGKITEGYESVPVETHIDALQFHVEFEEIHPFADGNGRIGRIIYLWHCSKLNVEPIDFSGSNRNAYYSLFPNE